MQLNLQNLQNLNIEGFFPVIINIKPIANLNFLLGLDTASEKEKQLSLIP